MPWSETMLRPWIAAELRYWAVPLTWSRVVDVGAGAGTAREFYGPRMPAARWTGIEIHEPYAEQFGLTEIYDNVIIADARTLEPWPEADLCIMADVAEHMPAGDAVRLWDKARENSRWLVLSMPLVPYPQGEEFGNPHERHMHDWAPGTALEAFAGIVSCALPPPGLAAGAFIARGHLSG